MANRGTRARFFLSRLALRLSAHNAFEAAATIAFWFFLSLLPLLVLLGFLVGQVARSRGVDTLVRPMLDVMPSGAEGIVRTELERMTHGGSGLAPLGVVGYFWTASSGLHNLMDVLEIAARVRRRPWWKQRLLALAWVVAGLATACALALSLVRMDRMIQHLDSLRQAIAVATPSTAPVPLRTGALPHPAGALRRRVHAALHTPLEDAVASTALLVVGLAFLAGFYRFAIEHPRRVARRIWPGAMTAVASWLVVSWGFGVYAVSASSYALYYGSLAAVAILLIWLYLTSLSLVIGSEVNALLEEP